MLISITINIEAVAKEVNPDNPETTVDQTTNAIPLTFVGDGLKDIVEFFLIPRSGNADPSHLFTGQEVMDQVMRQPMRDTNNGVAQRVIALIGTHAGDNFRDQLVTSLGAEAVKALYASASTA